MGAFPAHAEELSNVSSCCLETTLKVLYQILRLKLVCLAVATVNGLGLLLVENGKVWGSCVGLGSNGIKVSLVDWSRGNDTFVVLFK